MLNVSYAINVLFNTETITTNNVCFNDEAHAHIHTTWRKQSRTQHALSVPHYTEKDVMNGSAAFEFLHTVVSSNAPGFVNMGSE